MGWKRKPKEFVCPFCNADFDKKRQFKQHVKDKHPEHAENKDGSKPYFIISDNTFDSWSKS